MAIHKPNKGAWEQPFREGPVHSGFIYSNTWTRDSTTGNPLPRHLYFWSFFFSSRRLHVAMRIFVKIKNDVQIVDANADPLPHKASWRVLSCVWETYICSRKTSLCGSWQQRLGGLVYTVNWSNVIPKAWSVMKPNKLQACTDPGSSLGFATVGKRTLGRPPLQNRLRGNWED